MWATNATPAVVRRLFTALMVRKRKAVRHTLSRTDGTLDQRQYFTAPWTLSVCMGGGLWVISIPHKAKRTLEVFPLIISSRFRHLHTVWEVFQYMGHYKWIGLVAYLFLSKLFSGLPLVLCDMPCKSACWELTISHWAHNSEALLQLSCYNVVFDFKWMTLCA